MCADKGRVFLALLCRFDLMVLRGWMPVALADYMTPVTIRETQRIGVKARKGGAKNTPLYKGEIGH